MESVALVGIPIDANSSHRFGAEAGPAAIRGALHSGSGNQFTEHGVDALAALDDLGDLAVENALGSAADADLITSRIGETVAAGQQVISLGGDHSITYPILRGFAAHHPELTVVHIDAHPDLYDDLDGNPLSHASPFARALESGCMARLIQLGIRTATPHQLEQGRRFGVEMVAARELDRFDAGTINGPLYLTIDLDGLDPSVAPGVSHHEPGGLGVQEVLDIIDSLPAPIVGADVVELNPQRDVVDMTAMVGAKLVKEITGAMLGR
ncbi:MAG: agmatinase [Acidimicrobiales bacterium]